MHYASSDDCRLLFKVEKVTVEWTDTPAAYLENLGSNLDPGPTILNYFVVGLSQLLQANCRILNLASLPSNYFQFIIH